jgi:hypothetical protein
MIDLSSVFLKGGNIGGFSGEIGLMPLLQLLPFVFILLIVIMIAKTMMKDF